jgi:riboflavin kinase/FMN adenylyltransferase
MKIYRDLTQLPDFNNAVLTIGSFDGVHSGHQHIIEQLTNMAHKIGGETVLLTFYPHPRIELALQRGEKPDVKLLTTLAEKASLLEKYGINHLVVIPFNKAFSELSPDAYIQDFLVNHFHPKCIVIGYDHRFGKGRVGDIDYLRKFESQYNYRLAEISPQEVDDIAVSSTKVRNAVSIGDVTLAQKLMGHPYRLSGKVIYGQQIGRTLGFPTANISVESPYKIIPPYGIYSVMVHHQSQDYKGMLYIGDRPSLDDGMQMSIEVHIFGFDKDIYHQELQVDFIDYLRADAKFENLAALKMQLEQDRVSALHSLLQY